MEYKKRITELANGSFLYEYPDGIKIIYARDKEDIDTDIEISFEGGSMVQGHIMGLAHFVEHTMFLSQKLNKNFSFTNGITSRKQTVYQMSVNGNRIKKEVNDELKSRGFPDQVIEALSLMTHSDDVPYLDYVRSMKDNLIARKVKLADLAHNSDLSRLEKVDYKALERINKYKQAILILKRAEKQSKAK